MEVYLWAIVYKHIKKQKVTVFSNLLLKYRNILFFFVCFFSSSLIENDDQGYSRLHYVFDPPKSITAVLNKIWSHLLPYFLFVSGLKIHCYPTDVVLRKPGFRFSLFTHYSRLYLDLHTKFSKDPFKNGTLFSKQTNFDIYYIDIHTHRHRVLLKNLNWLLCLVRYLKIHNNNRKAKTSAVLG